MPTGFRLNMFLLRQQMKRAEVRTNKIEEMYPNITLYKHSMNVDLEGFGKSYIYILLF